MKKLTKEELERALKVARICLNIDFSCILMNAIVAYIMYSEMKLTTGWLVFYAAFLSWLSFSAFLNYKRVATFHSELEKLNGRGKV